VKILFFGDTPHRLAGAQKSLLVSLTSISELGIEPVVAFPFEGIFEGACRKAGLDVRIVPSPPALHSFGRALMRLSPLEQLRVVVRELLPFSRTLARLVEHEDVRAMHFNTPRGINTAGMAARMAGVGAALHLRGVPAIGSVYWLAAQALGDRFMLVAKTLESHFMPSRRARCSVVYDGVVTPPAVSRAVARASLRERLLVRRIDIGGDAVVFACVSSLTPFKGLHHLVDAARRVRDRGVDAIFLCAGVGQGDRYERWLAESVEAAGVGQHFHLLGFWEDVHGLLSGADATVLPSVQEEVLHIDGGTLTVEGNEGLPRAILESFAAGTPVIATRVAGVPEQVDDRRTGMLVEPGDREALAAALIEVARNAAWREEAGRIGRELVRTRFTVDAVNRKIAQVLLELGRNPPSVLDRARAVARLTADVARRA